MTVPISRRLLATAIASLLFAPLQVASPSAAAGVLSQASNLPLGPGGAVQGACNSIGGTIANLQNLQNFQSNLITTIEEIGKVINTGQMQQLAAEEKLTNQKLQEQAFAAKELAAADAKRKYLRQTTGINALSGSCSWQSGAGATLQGIQASRSIAQKALADSLAAQAPMGNPLDAVQNLAGAKEEDWQAGTILPVGAGAAQPSAATISRYIKSVVTPMNATAIPLQSANPSQGASPQKTNFQATENIVMARQSLASDTLALVARYNLPGIPDSLANRLWQQAGDSGTPPGETNGEISQDGLLQSIVTARYASPYFAQAIASHGNTWQVKQYAIMLAAKLRMNVQEERLLEHTVALQAAMLAQEENQRENTSLGTLRGQAIGQSLRGAR